jgi:hypothetical protein
VNIVIPNEKLLLTLPSLITEWRIQKRVEEQFNAFVTGFNELIPPDLVNVFDERELELLIGGIADIDVEDWKKHTDYRGYTEQDEVIKNFWTVCLPRFVMQFALLTIRSVSGAGMRSKSRDCCNSPPVLRVYLSMDSKIFKVAMGLVGLLLRSQVRTRRYQSRTPGKSDSFR